MVTSRAPTSKKTATGEAAKKPAAKKADAAAVDARKPVAKKAVAAKPGLKKAAVKTTPAVTPAQKTGKTLSARNVAAKSESGSQSMQKRNVSPEERYRMIAAAAYWRAERRNFAAGGALDDWVAAEAEIDAMLKAGE